VKTLIREDELRVVDQLIVLRAGYGNEVAGLI
jgi:hypothetical protein